MQIRTLLSTLALAAGLAACGSQAEPSEEVGGPTTAQAPGDLTDVTDGSADEVADATAEDASDATAKRPEVRYYLLSDQ